VVETELAEKDETRGGNHETPELSLCGFACLSAFTRRPDTRHSSSTTEDAASAKAR